MNDTDMIFHRPDDGCSTHICSNETTRHYIPEGSNLHTRRRENLKSNTEALWLEQCSKRDGICWYTKPELIFVSEFHTGTVLI